MVQSLPKKSQEELKAQKIEQIAKARAKRIELLKDPEYVARMKERTESKKVDKINKLHGGKGLKDVISDNIKSQHMITQKIDELSSKVFDLSVRLTPGSNMDSVSSKGDVESEFSDMNVIKSKKARKPKIVESAPEPVLFDKKDPKTEPEPEPEPKQKTKRTPAPKRKTVSSDEFLTV